MERTIVLVDDHSLFRNGLRGLLEHCAGCRVVGEAASGEEFLAMLPELEADIVFMDFACPVSTARRPPSGRWRGVPN